MLDAVAQYESMYMNENYYNSYNAGPGLLIIALLTIPFVVAAIVGMWKVFEKAGQEGWKAIIPVYNYITLLRIVGRSPWLALLFLLAPIPIIGALVLLGLGIIVANDLSKSFGKDVGMTLLILFLPFVAYLVLGFGTAKYVGPAGVATGQAPTPTAPTEPTPPVNTPPTPPTTPVA